MSIDYANQRSYLDDLFRVYPTIPDGIREIGEERWAEVEAAFNARDNRTLLGLLLALDLFPIKDSYVAYLKKDPASIERNPETINRLSGRLYELGLEELRKRASEPKETNRKIGPLFKRWVQSGVLGIPPVGLDEFKSNDNNAILNASDGVMTAFAHEFLNYNHEKGLDFVARFNGQYVIGEAKFLTDIGGHQKAQFSDAITTLTQPDVRAIKIAILDGILYIPSRREGGIGMYAQITNRLQQENIMSALVLREFLYQI